MVEVKAFFDKATSTLTYVVWDPSTKDALVIDPVLDFDQASSKVTEASAQTIIHFIQENSLVLRAILETHAHADHLTGAQVLKRMFPQAQLGIGERIREVQKTFSALFDMQGFPCDGRQFDHLFKDGEEWRVGSLSVKVRFTPGHTPACASYLIGNCLFTGDTLFMPDSGVGRCDFPGGNAETLYQSVTKKLYTLPDSTRTFTGHDYQPGGRQIQWEATVQAHKESNIHLKASATQESFVRFRTERDKTLQAPKLLLPSIQININAGRLPEPRSNGQRYLNIPVYS